MQIIDDFCGRLHPFKNCLLIKPFLKMTPHVEILHKSSLCNGSSLVKQVYWAGWFSVRGCWSCFACFFFLAVCFAADGILIWKNHLDVFFAQRVVLLRQGDILSRCSGTATVGDSRGSTEIRSAGCSAMTRKPQLFHFAPHLE